MTESDWPCCGNPVEMLDYLEGKVSDRKLRLFACACCRRSWHLLTVDACRRAVEVTELFADGLVSLKECVAAHAAAQHARPLYRDFNWAAAGVASPQTVAQVAAEAATNAARALGTIAANRLHSTARASSYTGATQARRTAAWDDYESAIEAAFLQEQQEHAALLREIVGNPFQSAEPLKGFRSVVVQLAEALYSGVDGSFALHDALVEEGHATLAEHFVTGNHPKGCWALDLILGNS